MIRVLQQLAGDYPDQFYFHVSEGAEFLHVDYSQTYLASAALARALEKEGVTEDSYIVADMPNCAELVFTVFAAAFLGATVVMINPRLSDLEKRRRVAEVEAATSQRGPLAITRQRVARLLVDVLHENPLYPRPEQVGGTYSDTPETKATLVFADSRVERFDSNSIGIVMFTSGTSGTPKAAQITWAELCGAAYSANEALGEGSGDVWQLALPMCHIGGLQVAIRSLLAGNEFLLYSHWNPNRVLMDALSFNVTHISVVDKMLQDLLFADEARVITQYRCILLGGAAVNEKTLRKAQRRGAFVYVSYGMTETCSLIACAPAHKGYDGWLTLLPGYEAIIVSPQKGVGQLAIKGPGVFEGYMNARMPLTEDGFMMTGDRATRNKDDRIKVLARTEDLIISGGENIYPAEIVEQLCAIPGVTDAYVFGTADETWGYRPVAFIEADYSVSGIARDKAQEQTHPHGDRTGEGVAGALPPDDATTIAAATCPQEFARNIHDFLEPRMSKLHHPKHILVLDEFPRTSAGKIDNVALKATYDKRIDIKSITLHRIAQPMTKMKTAKIEMTQRESIIVEVHDWAGRTGIGECVAFSTDWYLPETIEQDWIVLRDHLSKIVLGERYLHPSQVCRSFATFPSIAPYPLAKSAIESAIWDLYGKVTGQSIAQMIGGDPAKETPAGTVPGGTVIGLLSVEDTLAAVQRAVDAGYTRVKLKIAPGHDFDYVAAVRKQFPDLMIILDANQSYSDVDFYELKRLDALDIECIEEPLDPKRPSRVGPQDIFTRLVELQKFIRTPICLDESVVTRDDMAAALSHPELRCYAVKLAKFGGVQPALDFVNWTSENGIETWIGGIYDTGISKRLSAAFEMLPYITIPGDISDSAFYFEGNLTEPPLTLEGGRLTVNPEGYESGLGCELNRDYLAQVSIQELTIGQ